jgi:hypothetical protein
MPRGNNTSTSTSTSGNTSTSPEREILSRQHTLSNLIVAEVTKSQETFADVTKSVLHLAGNFEAMKSLCANYGLAAALILTMAFANYSALDSKAWTDYKGVWITSNYCQDLARQSCNSTIQVTSQLRLGGVGVRQSDWTQGAEFYCTDVFDGIGNFGILGLQGALRGPEVESGISESWVCKERWGPEVESGISES